MEDTEQKYVHNTGITALEEFDGWLLYNRLYQKLTTNH